MPAARLAKVIAQSALRPRLAFDETSVIQMRCWPTDLDFVGHMNNGRYLTLMDLGRWDFVLRATRIGDVVARGWRPMAGLATLRFKRSLEPFQHFALHTRIACWDAKWFFFEQRFVRGDRAVAVGWVKFLFRRPKGNVPTAEVLAAAGWDRPSPPLPDFVRAWVDAEAKLA